MVLLLIDVPPLYLEYAGPTAASISACFVNVTASLVSRAFSTDNLQALSRPTSGSSFFFNKIFRLLVNMARFELGGLSSHCHLKNRREDYVLRTVDRDGF